MSYPTPDTPGTLSAPLRVPTVPGSPMPALPLEGHSSVVEVEHGLSASARMEASDLRPVSERGSAPRFWKIHRPGTVPVLVLAGLVAVFLVIPGVVLCVEKPDEG